MKASAPVQTGLALALCGSLATGAMAAGDASVSTAGGSPPGMQLVKSLPLSGTLNGIVRIECNDSEHCQIHRMMAQVDGPAGMLELWQDARITPKLRDRLWDRPGGPIGFSGDMARNAMLVLRNAAGAIVAQTTVETPLADLEPLLLGTPMPTFLISIDYRTPQTVVIGRGILQADPASSSLSYATYTGPRSMPIIRPDGINATVAIPGPDAVIAFQNNFVLETNAAARTASLTVTGCYPDSYINYRTKRKIDTVLTVHARYDLHDGTWTRAARLAYDNCGGQYKVPDPGPIMNSEPH
jgi:hypothetical protein